MRETAGSPNQYAQHVLKLTELRPLPNLRAALRQILWWEAGYLRRLQPETLNIDGVIAELQTWLQGIEQPEARELLGVLQKIRSGEAVPYFQD